MNKLGINLWNWQPALSDACLGLPEKAREMGFTAIELPMTTPAVSDRLRAEIRESGLAVSLCAALGKGRDLSNFDPAVREATMQYLTDCLSTGESLGASILAGPLYTGGGKCHVLPEEERKREWELAVNGLKELARRADACGMRLAIEPLHRYRTSVINTTAQGLAMVADIGMLNLGLHFDTFHAALEERDLLEALRDALGSGKLMHVHACANNRSGPGQGIIPWAEVFGLIRNYGYEGHITMETFAPGGLDASYVNVLGTPDEIALSGIHCLRQYFSE